MSERISFTAHGDATGAQFTVGNTGASGYREWLWNTLYAYGWTPQDLSVQTAWYGWSGMDATFGLDVECGANIPQLRADIAYVLEHGGLMVDATVSTPGVNQTNCSSGQMINIGNFDGGTVYGGSQNNQGSSNVNTGGGNNNNKPSTFDEITAWLKAHETEAMFGGFILAVLLLRR